MLPDGSACRTRTTGPPRTGAASPERAVVRVALGVSPFEAMFSVNSVVSPAVTLPDACPSRTPPPARRRWQPRPISRNAVHASRHAGASTTVCIAQPVRTVPPLTRDHVGCRTRPCLAGWWAGHKEGRAQLVPPLAVLRTGKVAVQATDQECCMVASSATGALGVRIHWLPVPTTWVPAYSDELNLQVIRTPRAALIRGLPLWPHLVSI